MEAFSFPLLSLVTLIPLVGALFLAFIPRGKEGTMKGFALILTLANLLLSILILYFFDSKEGGMQLKESIIWIPEYGINYLLGIDGISLFMVLLTAFLSPLCVMASFNDITKRVKEFLIALLALESGMIGVFVSLDLFLFYLFWEAMLIPMYLLIGVWGNPERRVYAALKFVIFTMIGSVLMLVGIIFLYFQHLPSPTFNLLELLKLNLSPSIQNWLFLAFFLAFAIKVPLFPFHTWLPDAHTEAPTVGSVMLAAVLLKMGAYGFLRFSIPLFPLATMKFAPIVSILALIGIIYGALVCLVQKDLKRMIAFSSVSHLGFVVLGLFSLNIQAIEGGIMQMINHGLSTGALFLIVGMIYERRHTRLIEEFGGLSKVMPIYATVFMIVTLSSIGLPGLNGFIGEFLIILGVFRTHTLFGVLAATGVVLSAWYMLWMYQRVMFGEITVEKNRGLKDLSLREFMILIPILFFIIGIGVYPKPILSRMEASVKTLIDRAKKEEVSKGPQTPKPFGLEEKEKGVLNSEGLKR